MTVYKVPRAHAAIRKELNRESDLCISGSLSWKKSIPRVRFKFHIVEIFEG